MLRAICLCIAALSAPAARAEQPADMAARQAAGLFMQSCVQYAGDRQALRAWARKLGLKILPPRVQERFLNGQPGIAFDASNKVGKFVLASQDNGPCATVAQKANGPSVIASLEQDLREARIAFRISAERGDAEEKAIRHREYLATFGQREWLLLVSTVQDAAGGETMLTVNRR